ncbi:MAG: hypothetical protein PVI30_27940, partial [Myxococcales bacterium]
MTATRISPAALRRAAALGLMMLSALAGGCVDEVQRTACERDAEGCESGYVCIQRECVPCVSDRECLLEPSYGRGSACIDGACCTPGEPGCGCFETDTCALGATCGGDDDAPSCEVCPPGTRDCPCIGALPADASVDAAVGALGGGECADGSVCLEGICAAPGCSAGDIGCPCDGEGECAGEGECTTERLCEACYPGREGCACQSDGSCEEGLTCADGRCETCVAGSRGCACRAGGDGAACEAGLSCEAARCSPMPRSCEELDCLAQGRLCEGEPDARCTECDGSLGFVPDGEGNCVQPPGACISSDECDEGQACLRLSDASPPFCAPIPECVQVDVPAGEMGSVWDPQTQDCVPCASCADVAGSTGRLWPTRSAAGVCVCETEAGYYFDASLSALAPRPCDADGDGWVQEPARQFLASNEIALRDNARCNVLEIDAFELQNERGQRRRVPLADLSLPSDRLALFESVKTDSQALVEGDQFMPPYGGRRPAAAELNPLTKACVSADADYNANGIADIEENPLSSSELLWMAPFWRMSHFLELNRSRYVDGGDGPGRIRIEERRRCDAGEFPLQVGGGGYYRECTRGRRSDFNRGLDAPGADFAEWSCAGASGSCALPEVVALTDGRVDLDSGRVVGATTDAEGVPLHPGCSAPALADPYAEWDGMGHHSQFQCAQFVNTLSRPAVPYELDLADEGTGGAYEAHLCELASDADPDAETFPVSCERSGTTVNAAPGDVGIAAITYRDYLEPEDYDRGCVNECAHFLSLCPAYDRDPSSNLAGCDRDMANFGLIECNQCRNIRQPCTHPENLGICRPGRVVCNANVESCESIIPVDLSRMDDVGDQVDDNCDG